MTSILQSLSRTIHYSLALAILLFLGLHFSGDGFAFDRTFWSWLARYVHVIVAIMWIGLFGILILFKYQTCQKFQMNKNQLLVKLLHQLHFFTLDGLLHLLFYQDLFLHG